MAQTKKNFSPSLTLSSNDRSSVGHSHFFLLVQENLGERWCCNHHWCLLSSCFWWASLLRIRI